MPKTEVLKFVQSLHQCIKEYKKQMIDTRDDSDAAYFFKPELKKFLQNHKEELNILSQLNFEKPFMSWVKGYLFKS